MYAMWNGDVYEAYDLYLSGKMWDAAHDLAVLELAPDAINRRDLDLLKGLLERFEGKEMEGWRDRGKVRHFF
jgi:nuclear pore complex protein Nup98-Nup96